VRLGSGNRQEIQNDLERQLHIFTTGFAAGDHALRLLKNRSINENNLLIPIFPIARKVKAIQRVSVFVQPVKSPADKRFF
jgi:hypothetical protein